MTKGTANVVRGIGIAALVVGWTCTWLTFAAKLWLPAWLIPMAATAFVAWCLTGLLDIILIVTQFPTITCYVRRWLPRWADLVLLAVTLGVVWYLFGVEIFMLVLAGNVHGHLGWE